MHGHSTKALASFSFGPLLQPLHFYWGEGLLHFKGYGVGRSVTCVPRWMSQPSGSPETRLLCVCRTSTEEKKCFDPVWTPHDDPPPEGRGSVPGVPAPGFQGPLGGGQNQHGSIKKKEAKALSAVSVSHHPRATLPLPCSCRTCLPAPCLSSASM